MIEGIYVIFELIYSQLLEYQPQSYLTIIKCMQLISIKINESRTNIAHNPNSRLTKHHSRYPSVVLHSVTKIVLMISALERLHKHDNLLWHDLTAQWYVWHRKAYLRDI